MRVENTWVFFNDRFGTVDIPTKQVKQSGDLPWLTRILKHQIRQKSRWFKKTKQPSSSQVWTKYQQLQKQNHQIIRKAYHNYVNNILTPRTSENPKIFWRYVKSLKWDCRYWRSQRSRATYLWQQGQGYT